MLVIRKEQMEVFKQYAERIFIESVVIQLRTNHKEAVKDMLDEQLFKRVEYGLQRSKKYGLTWKKDLSAFVSLMFEIAPDFDKYSAFQRPLTDESVSPNERMSVLLEETTDADWQKAREFSSQAEWPNDLLLGEKP